MLETPLHHAATALLEAAIRIAPSGVRDWGRAMLGELYYIDGGWAAIVWAIGGASVLGKHALLSLLIPGRHGQGVFGDGGLFAKNVTLRKVALMASVAYVVGALLFFAAPPFRQGLRVSMASWNALFHVTEQSAQPGLEALRRKAEARHDAEGLVFAAVRVQNASESARLAEKAVRLDPRLNWTYAVVAVRHPDLPQIGQWMPRLERWEPQNALFRLITAESIDIDDYTDASQRSSVGKQNEREADPAWRMTMAAAFASPKFDDYLGRLKELDQRVVRRYGYDHPQELLSGETVGLPTHAISDAHRFAGTLIQSGQAYESGGRRKRAAEEYWSVARFGQVLDSQAHLQYEHAAGASLQLMAYQRLQALSEKDGNADEAALFAYLGRKLAPGATGADALRERVFAQEVSRRNAAVLQVSGLMMLIFSGLLVFAAAALIARNRRRQGLRRFSPGLTVLALTSAVGLLLSSATLYLTYRPYWYIFQGAILKGETSQTGDLRSFLAATHTLPGLRPYPGEMLRLPVYFWTGVIFIGVIGLMLILVRHFRGHARLAQVQPNPRVQ